ncbi:hypothetical protein QQ045_024837 [Rhodiola kirilowii]
MELADLCSSGFGSYLLGLNKRTYEQAGVDTPGNTSGSYKDPAFGWMAGFLFVSAFVGLLALVPLRNVLWERCHCCGAVRHIKGVKVLKP